MRRALVLNAGSSWAAYQVGALEELVGRRGLRFDICAGTGIGAMNAALVACGALDALLAFWDRIGVRNLLRPNLRTPWRGPCVGTPQREFIARHVDETELKRRGVTLLVSTLDLQSGRQRVLRYPGEPIPLMDGLMGAVATPGLIPPLTHQGRQLAEGTFVESFLLRQVRQFDVDEVIAIATTLPAGEATPRRYVTWRAVLERALAMNLAHDVRSALTEAARQEAAAAARQTIKAQVPSALAARIGDPELAERLRNRLEKALDAPPRVPVVHALMPSRPLDFPLWRFRKKDIASARVLGRADARSGALACSS